MNCLFVRPTNLIITQGTLEMMRAGRRGHPLDTGPVEPSPTAGGPQHRVTHHLLEVVQADSALGLLKEFTRSSGVQEATFRCRGAEPTLAKGAWTGLCELQEEAKLP